MLEPKLTSRFKKNYALMKKRGYNMSLIDNVVETLLAEKPLSAERRDHPLRGNWKGFRECHILPDWLLIYKIDGVHLLLHLERTGTHADLLE